MKINYSLMAAVAGALLLAGCASTPKRVEQLETARTAVESLAQDPQASQVAGNELQAARTSLQQADQAVADRRPLAEINHLAYLAQRSAEVGKERIAEGRSRQQVEQAQAERNRVLLEARTAEAQRARNDAQQARGDADQARSEAQQARSEALSEAQRAQAAQQEAEAARAALEQERQALLALQAKQTERGMVLTLGDVLFDTGKATLKPGARERLDRLASFLQEYQDTRIVIEGHTDSVGAEEYNQELSQRRAQSVADALATRNVSSSRFQVMGRGEGTPVADNDTAAGRQQNRRVEIVFSDQGGKFAGAR